MPDFALRSEANTSWVLLPIEATMPIPVTATRFISASLGQARGADAIEGQCRPADHINGSEHDPVWQRRFRRVPKRVHAPVGCGSVPRKSPTLRSSAR